MVVKKTAQSGKEKRSFISRHVEQDLPNSRETTIRELAGWLTHEEAEELRQTTEVFRRIERR